MTEHDVSLNLLFVMAAVLALVFAVADVKKRFYFSSFIMVITAFLAVIGALIA